MGWSISTDDRFLLDVIGKWKVFLSNVADDGPLSENEYYRFWTLTSSLLDRIPSQFPTLDPDPLIRLASLDPTEPLIRSQRWALADVILRSNVVIARVTVDHEPIRCVRIDGDGQRPVAGAMPRPRRKHLPAAGFTAQDARHVVRVETHGTGIKGAASAAPLTVQLLRRCRLRRPATAATRR